MSGPTRSLKHQIALFCAPSGAGFDDTSQGLQRTHVRPTQNGPLVIKNEPSRLTTGKANPPHHALSPVSN